MSQLRQSGSRLAYIDWMRGLACVLMFQWHCYNSWLAPGERMKVSKMISFRPTRYKLLAARDC